MMLGRMVVAVVVPAALTGAWASRTLMRRHGAVPPVNIGFPARLRGVWGPPRRIVGRRLIWRVGFWRWRGIVEFVS